MTEADLHQIASDDTAYKMFMMRTVGRTEEAIGTLKKDTDSLFRKTANLEKISHTHDQKQKPQQTQYVEGEGVQASLNGKAKIIAMQSGGVVAGLWIMREVIVAIIKFAGG